MVSFALFKRRGNAESGGLDGRTFIDQILQVVYPASVSAVLFAAAMMTVERDFVYYVVVFLFGYDDGLGVHVFVLMFVPEMDVVMLGMEVGVPFNNSR